MDIKYYHHLSWGDIASNCFIFITPLMGGSTIFMGCILFFYVFLCFVCLFVFKWPGMRARLFLKLLTLLTGLTFLAVLILHQKFSKLPRKTSLFFSTLSTNNEPIVFISSLLFHFQEVAPEPS